MFRPIRIKNYVAAMESYGFSPALVLAGSGIELGRLSDSAYLIDIDQTNTVIANILRLKDDNGAGFEMGLKSELGDLGIVAYGMMSSKTIRQALGLWIRYSNSLLGALSTIRPHTSGPEHFIVEIVEEVPTVGGLRFCAEEFIAITCKLGGALAQEEPLFQRLEMAYPEPHCVERYREFCNGPVMFDAPQTLMTLETQWVNKPLRTCDNEFNDICIQHCSQIMKQIVQDSPLLSQIRALLLKSGAAIPKLENVARQLGLSSRTLRRRLLDEGTSFQDMVNEFRLDLAKQYAGHSNMMAKEISYLLGYANVNAFNRMFNAKTGKTLRQYRDVIQQRNN
jgi:AraC-like DNA-binding protein